MSKYIKLENLKWHSPDETIVKPLIEFYITESDIADLPTIEVSEDCISRAEGEWVLSELQHQEDNDNDNYAYVCTNCKHTDIHAKTQEVPYCWWCGAKMKGD